MVFQFTNRDGFSCPPDLYHLCAKNRKGQLGHIHSSDRVVLVNQRNSQPRDSNLLATWRYYLSVSVSVAKFEAKAI